MIPKIIHYFWGGNSEIPSKLRACIDSWAVYCPDYEIKLWTAESFGADTPRWIRQAVDSGKYAFAADYVRCYALYHFGGFYLDTDVELRKSFDPFLSLPYVFGRETNSPTMDTGTIGSAKGMPLFRMMLDYYNSRPFIQADGSLDMLPIPLVINNVMNGHFRFEDIESPDKFKQSDNTICILPSDYFSPIDLQNMAMKVTPRTVSIHHFAGTWKPRRYRFKKKIQRFLGRRITMAIIHIKDFVLRRNHK